MEYKILKYDDLVNNPQDFTIKVVCIKYTFHNEISKVVDMFNFMDKHCEDATFSTKVCEDIVGYMCTCVGYMKASYFLNNYIDICIDKKELNPIFYLWQQPYNETTDEMKDITLSCTFNNHDDIFCLKKLKDIVLSAKNKE